MSLSYWLSKPLFRKPLCFIKASPFYEARKRIRKIPSHGNAFVHGSKAERNTRLGKSPGISEKDEDIINRTCGQRGEGLRRIVLMRSGEL